jgi:hypothetical protein
VPVGRPTDEQMEITDLTPGQEYKFRVSAVNSEGESVPLEAEQAIVAKDPYSEDTSNQQTPHVIQRTQISN